jgi:tetratricopeptide (TPR) repeat protein
MGAEDGLAIAEQLIFAATGEHLDDLTRQIFMLAWDGKAYHEIADQMDYEDSYVRDRGSQLFKLLSQVLPYPIRKSNFRGYIERQPRPAMLNPATPNFVGRDQALADLDQRVQQGAKLILIQGEGGLGKTTLARKYLELRGYSPQIELWMETEAEWVTPVETLVEEWLRDPLEEEPGRDFAINLERLRRCLRQRSQPIGILIDNLESALDASGRFSASRRPYVDLLRVLADPKLNAVTLIVSRERIHEARLNLELYCLEGLSQAAWRQYFTSCKIAVQDSILTEMWRSYGGNAKAMKILTGAILTDFEGDLETYWQQNSHNLLAERELEDLVVSQFDRVAIHDPQAYRLLCRLGCYRYQEVSYVSTEGVCCLLWDVARADQFRIIRSLQDRSLIESRQGKKYWLHPVIRTQALRRLRSSKDWEISNQQAAECWLNSVQVVGGVEDALRALEAYYHYLEISQFEQARDVIVQTKSSQWGEEIPLGWLFYRLGLLQQMVAAISRIIDNVQPDRHSGILLNLLGYIQRLSGNVQGAIDRHQEAHEMAESFQDFQLQVSSLLHLGLCRKDLWELESAIANFNQIIALMQSQTEVRCDNYVYSQCCLAYLHSCLGQEQLALAFAQQVNLEALTTCTTAWGAGYSLLYLAATYRNLGEIERSHHLYEQTLQFSESNDFSQIKANAFHGLAQLHRAQEQFEIAIEYHTKAVDLLEKLGAKCDLAEACFQMGLTYAAISDPNLSRTQFYKAMQLFSEVGAPKHLARVKQAMRI